MKIWNILHVHHVAPRKETMSVVLQPWPLRGRGTPGSQVSYGFMYSMEFPGSLYCLSCKISPCCFVRHVEENLDMIQNLAPHWTHGMVLWTPTLALKTFEVVQWIKCALSSFVDFCEILTWWWYCALFCGGPHWGSNSGAVPNFFSQPRGVKINLYPLQQWCLFFLCLMSKSQWCTFEIDLKRTALLVDVARKEKSQNKFIK